MAIKPNDSQTSWLAVFHEATGHDGGRDGGEDWEPRAARLERPDLRDAYDKREAWADAGRVVGQIPGAELLWVSRHLDLVKAVTEWRHERDRARTLVYWPTGGPIQDAPPETLVLEFEEDEPSLADYLDEAPSFLPEGAQPIWLARALDPRQAEAETAATVAWWWRVVLQPEPEAPPHLAYILADGQVSAWEEAVEACGEEAVLWVTRETDLALALAERESEAASRWTVLGRQIGDTPGDAPRVHFFRFPAPLPHEIARERALADGRLSSVLWVTREADQAAAIAEWEQGASRSWTAIQRGHLYGELATFRLDYPDRVERHRAEEDAEFRVDPHLAEMVWVSRETDEARVLAEAEAALPDLHTGHVGHGVFDAPPEPATELEPS